MNHNLIAFSGPATLKPLLEAVGWYVEADDVFYPDGSRAVCLGCGTPLTLSNLDHVSQEEHNPYCASVDCLLDYHFNEVIERDRRDEMNVIAVLEDGEEVVHRECAECAKSVAIPREWRGLEANVYCQDCGGLVRDIGK